MKQIIEKYAEIFTAKELELITSNTNDKRVTFRVNDILSNKKEIEEALQKENIAFDKGPLDGSFILSPEHSERDLWDLQIYKKGKIYMQSLSSQLPVHFFDTAGKERVDLKILDATAAPGGKTSQLATLFPNAEIYAFEKSRVRYEKMLHNLNKLGVTNVKRIYADVQKIGTHISTEEYFDKILLDVPCSTEGKVNVKKVSDKPEIIGSKKYYNIQKTIVDSVMPYLKDGGEIIYSTCTINPLENEGIVHYIISKFKDIEVVDLDMEFIDPKFFKYTKEGITEYSKYKFHPSVSKTLRVFPSDITEGFYIAKLRKKSS